MPSFANALLASLLLTASLLACAPLSAISASHPKHTISFSAKTGSYTMRFKASQGTITIGSPGTKSRVVIREIPGGRALDLLYGVRSMYVIKAHDGTGTTYSLHGASAWASFVFTLELGSSTPGLIRLKLDLTPRRALPVAGKFTADVRFEHASRASFKEYAPGPPLAGTSVMVSSTAFHSTVLYLANLTSLGVFFDRSGSGAAHSVFSYPRAGTKGALVGATGDGSFGYPISASDLSSLPPGKTTRVLDSYLYVAPGVPTGEASISDTYLRMLGTVYQAMPKPAIPPVNWQPLANQEASDLLEPANLVAVHGIQYLRSYVSDTRSAPELITQAGVLAGVKAYDAKFHVSLPLDALLERTLPTFYDPTYHTVVNGLGHDPNASGESWYVITNMISLLQLSQRGDTTARNLLLNSVGAVESLAHVNGYEFPQNFLYSTWKSQDTGLQSDVAGGYAWLMLGLYDLTQKPEYLAEAKAAIVHLEGHGFNLSYETHMTAYGAAAAQRLYSMTEDSRYHRDAEIALANLFHATSLWDCTYGTCIKGTGYHTYFGLNPLPWADYIAMLEQYEAWLGLRDYLTYASKEPSYLTDLVRGFLTNTPLTMQYAFPTRLPPHAATSAAGEYAFVPSNNLKWDIPLEDLRTGEQISGTIGQEIYGAGGPFMFAAGAP